MNLLRLTLRQAAYENRAFRRNPASAFFTVVFPLLFLVIFTLLFGGTPFGPPGRQVSGATFYTPGIIAFSVISACYTNLAMSITIARDSGILKRIRGTPLPPLVYLAGRVLNCVIVAVFLVIVVAAFGSIVYGVQLPTQTLPALIVTLLVGAASFSALGLAVAGLVPNADAAPAVVNFSILPLLFISDVFISLENAPSWLLTISDLFPVRHFARALFAAFDPFATGTGFRPGDLLVIAGWGIAGLLIAVRTFTWEPRT